MGARTKKVKDHLRDNKKIYAAVGLTAVSAAGITTVIMRHNSRAIGVTTNRAIGVIGDNNVSLSSGRDMTMNNVSFISQNRQGSPSWVVRCLETGEIFTSQAKAAIDCGIPPLIFQNISTVRETMHTIFISNESVWPHRLRL